jgi:hypothetical protein
MRTRRAAIYARVSTDHQTTENQIGELRTHASAWGGKSCGSTIDQGISGAKRREQRPAYDQMLKDAARKEFDVIAAWSVDRLGQVPSGPCRLPRGNPWKAHRSLPPPTGLGYNYACWQGTLSDVRRVCRI